MGVIEEIKNLFRVGADVSDKFDKFNNRSIARGAMEQSFVFQCIIDDTVPVDMASVCAQQLDRVYASWTQIYLSSIGLIDLNYIKNPRQFVAKYQPRNTLLENWDDDIAMESADEELKDKLYGDDEMLFTESADRNGVQRIALLTPGKQTTSMRNLVKDGLSDPLSIYNTKPISGQARSRVYTEAPEDEDIIRKTLDNQAKNERDRLSSQMLKVEPKTPKMSDNDVKKINDMQPYVIDLKLLAVKDGTSLSQWITFSVGVKTAMHLGSSEKIAANLVDVLRNRNPLFNFIKWTTGEISLIKDIILHLDDINFDIANKSDRTGKYFSALKELKKRYLKIGMNGVNRIAPFATIVLSSSTYHDIKDKYGYDVKNMAFAKKIMSELFLMCFIIIDDATHTYDILVDGQADFQTYSLETLEREVSMRSSKLSKELTRMLGSN
jgi:hypothetical protein